MEIPEGLRACPTRADGGAALIAHQITLAHCQKRQREHFHKCPTCAHYNPRAVETPAFDRPTGGDGRPLTTTGQ